MENINKDSKNVNPVTPPTPPTNPFDGMKDVTRNCVEQGCGKSFPLTVKEQLFYREMGLVEPKRCPSCRMKRRMEKEGRLRIMNGTPDGK